MWPFILLALVVYGFANFYRKRALGGLDPVIAGFIESASQMLFAWIAVLIFAEPSLAFTFDSIAAGFALFLGLTLLYTALKTGYASSVAIIINLNALVTVPIALLFLNESLSLQALGGVALAVLVVPLLGSFRVNNGGTWLKYAMASMVFLGVMNYFNAAATLASGVFLAFAFFMTTATLFYAVFVLARKRKELSVVRLLDVKRLSFSGFCFAVATLFMFTAYSLGPASIIVPVVNMNLVVTAFLASVFYKEKLGWKGWAAVAFAVASVWLLAG